MVLILQIFPNVTTLIILECHFIETGVIDSINLSKILQRTLLRGGDCNLGWSWKKISLQCPELGLWTIPGETGLRESDCRSWHSQTWNISIVNIFVLLSSSTKRVFISVFFKTKTSLHHSLIKSGDQFIQHCTVFIIISSCSLTNSRWSYLRTGPKKLFMSSTSTQLVLMCNFSIQFCVRLFEINGILSEFFSWIHHSPFNVSDQELSSGS